MILKKIRKLGAISVEFILITVLLLGMAGGATVIMTSQLNRAAESEMSNLSGNGKTINIDNLLSDNDMKIFDANNPDAYIVISKKGKVTYYPNGKSAGGTILVTEKQYKAGTKSFDLPDGFIIGKTTRT